VIPPHMLDRFPGFPERWEDEGTGGGSGGRRFASRPSDHALVEEVLAGRRERFALLVRRYQATLFRQALSMGVDEDTARDLVQDAFLRAYQNLEGFRERDRFRVWMGSILRNRCLDHMKSARVRRREPLSPGLPDPGVGPEGEEERRTLGGLLNQALAGLPPDQREAFVLRHVEGLSYEEMASLAEVSVSAAKMRVHRAREALREALRGPLEMGADGPHVTGAGPSSSM
jgi:RNA polymerase sigma-70 factor, ECF subfamily